MVTRMLAVRWPEYVTRRFVALSKAAGLRQVRLHDLRHGAASLMIAAGVPIAVVRVQDDRRELRLRSGMREQEMACAELEMDRQPGVAFGPAWRPRHGDAGRAGMCEPLP